METSVPEEVRILQLLSQQSFGEYYALHLKLVPSFCNCALSATLRLNCVLKTLQT